MIKIMIADDQKLIRQSLKIVLNHQEDFTVTNIVSDGNEVLETIEVSKPDIILMDIRMPVMNGVECTKIIKKQYPEIKIIVLTTFDDDEYILKALRDGASGYLLKGISMDELVSAIRKVYEGETMLNAEITSKVVSLFSKIAKTNYISKVNSEKASLLGKTELKIVKLIGTGLSNKEISATIFLSEGTIRNDISTILKKLELRDRTQLAIWAVQTGLVHPIEFANN
jgi:DNA-binding NarL/FixJ family response regulator